MKSTGYPQVVPQLSTAQQAYMDGCARARQRSLTSDYRGCSVHLNVVITRRDGYPQITGYTLSDWCDDSTVDTFVNGEVR